MFSVEILEKIFSDEDIMKCPIGMQSTIIHGIERILDENGYKVISPDMGREVQE